MIVPNKKRTMVAQSYANDDYGIDWSGLDKLNKSHSPESEKEDLSKLDQGIPQ